MPIFTTFKGKKEKKRKKRANGWLAGAGCQCLQFPLEALRVTIVCGLHVPLLFPLNICI